MHKQITQWAWLIGIWIASVAALSILAYLIRFVIG